MANVFRSKEVYKHLKYDLHGRNEIVPVQGVYISGEYRPPYYNESGIHIYEISSKHANIVSYQDISTDKGEDGMVRILDFSVDMYTTPTITTYTTANDECEDGMVRILDFNAEFLQPNFQMYTSVSDDADTGDMVKILDFGCEFIPISQPIMYLTQRDESTPEPMLRLSSIVSEKAIVENYTQ